MRAWIIIFVIGEGPAALVAALMCASMRTDEQRWPSLFKVLTLWFAAIAVSRIVTLWNVVTHGQGMVLPDRYMKWAIAIAAIQALMTWGAVFILVLSVMDVPLGRTIRRMFRRS